MTAVKESTMTFELLLQGRRGYVTWEGETGEDAARRYVDMHRDETVIAWRNVRHGLFFGPKPIIDGTDTVDGPTARRLPWRGGRAATLRSGGE
jgi:hypothetical protein